MQNNMKKAEIIEKLTEKGVKFNKADKKDVLLGLLEEEKSVFTPADTFQKDAPVVKQPESPNMTWSMKKPRNMKDWSARQLKENKI